MYNLESFQKSSDFDPLSPPDREDKPQTVNRTLACLASLDDYSNTSTQREWLLHHVPDFPSCACVSTLTCHHGIYRACKHSHAALIWRPSPSYSPGQPRISCAGPSYVHLCSGLAAAGAASTCLCGSTGSRSTHSHSLPAQGRRSHNMPSRQPDRHAGGCGSTGKHQQPGSRPQRADFRISSLSRPSP